MKTMKKTVFKILSAALAVTLLVGCVNVGTVGTVNGQKMSKQLYLFYLTNIKSSLEQEATTDGTVTAEQYWETQVDGLSATENAKKLALDEVARTIVVREQAAELKLDLTAEDKTAVNNNVNNLVDQLGSKKEYDKWVKEQGLTNDLIKYILEGYILEDKLYDYHYGESSTFKPTDAELEAFLTENYKRAKHVLILNSDEATGEALTGEALEQARATAEDVRKKALAGVDFDKLIKDYGKDPGTESNPDGYYFTKGELVKPFEDAVNAMQDNAISEVVVVDYGFHIIKRLPLDPPKYIEGNRDTLAQAMANKEYTDKIKEFIAAADIKTNKDYDTINVLKLK